MKEEKKKASRDTSWGRWKMIRECRIPTEMHSGRGGKLTPMCRYLNSRGEPEWIAPGIVKAVLLEISEWDDGQNDVYKGLAHFSFATQIPERTIRAAISALKEAGLLKRVRRGIKQTALSVIDWSRVEELRRPFHAAPNEDEQDEHVVDTETTTEPVSSLDYAPSVVEELLDGPLREKLSEKEAESLSRSLCRKNPGCAPLLAIAKLTPQDIAGACKADKPIAYLRSRIDARLGELARIEPERNDATPGDFESVVVECEGGAVTAVQLALDLAPAEIDDSLAALSLCGDGRVVVGRPYITHDPDGTLLLVPLAPIGSELAYERVSRTKASERLIAA